MPTQMISSYKRFDAHNNGLLKSEELGDCFYTLFLILQKKNTTNSNFVGI